MGGERVAAGLLGVLALLGGVAARAGDAPRVERLDLPACIARAVAAAPEIATARARVEERERERQRAKAARFLPEAGITSTLAPVPGAEGKVDGVLPDEQVMKTHDIGPATTVRLGFVQPLWTAGKITAGINAAAAGVDAGLAATERTAAEVVEQTKTLYYNVLLARSVEGVLADTRDAFAKALATARRRREEDDGGITELDILNLRVGSSEVAKEMPRLRAGGENALEGLKRLMGLPPDAPVDLKDTRLEPEPNVVVPLERYESELFEKDPVWKEVNFGVTAKEEEVKRARAGYYPQVFLKGGFDYGYAPDRRRQTNPFVYDAFNYLRGPGGALAVGWNLSFHTTAAEVASKRAEVLTVESQRRSTRVGLPVELRVTYRNALAARDQMEELSEGRGAGRAIVTFSVANFDLGVGEPANILQGLALYARVSSNYYEAVRNYNVALATLARLMGETTAGSAVAAAEPIAPAASPTK